jgi:hypothetical protein
MKTRTPGKRSSYVILKEVKDLGRGRRLFLFHRRQILRPVRSSGATAPGTGQSGLGLVETLVAVAILGTCVVAFAGGLSTGSLAVNEQRVEMTAQALAQDQLEFIKNAVFVPGAGSYPAVPSPSGYAVNVAVTAVPGADANIQKITVIVLRDGAAVLTLADYKVDR